MHKVKKSRLYFMRSSSSYYNTSCPLPFASMIVLLSHGNLRTVLFLATFVTYPFFAGSYFHKGMKLEYLVDMTVRSL